MSEKTDYHSEIKKLYDGFSSLVKLGVKDLRRGFNFAAEAMMGSTSSPHPHKASDEAPYTEDVDLFVYQGVHSKPPPVIYVMPEPQVDAAAVPPEMGTVASQAPDSALSFPEPPAVDDAQSHAKSAYIADKIDDVVIGKIFRTDMYPKVHKVAKPEMIDGATAICYGAVTANKHDEGYRWILAGIACQEGPGGHVMSHGLQRIREFATKAASFKTEAEAYRAGIEELLRCVNPVYELNIILDNKSMRGKMTEIRRKTEAGTSVTGVWAGVAEMLPGRFVNVAGIEKFDNSYYAFFGK